MKILFVFGGKGNAFFNMHQIFRQKKCILMEKSGCFTAFVCGSFAICVVVLCAERVELV